MLKRVGAFCRVKCTVLYCTMRCQKECGMPVNEHEELHRSKALLKAYSSFDELSTMSRFG